jgi:manganese transport system ATP-binding protein
VLLMRTVLMHGDSREVLRPENLALAFGLDTVGAADSRP